MAEQIVFVYGSLKQGFYNHNFYLKGATFLGNTVTKEAVYGMISMGAFPAVTRKGDHAITGEIYSVNEQTMKDLDRLESNGTFYLRTPVEVEDWPTTVWMYILIDSDMDNFNKFDRVVEYEKNGKMVYEWEKKV